MKIYKTIAKPEIRRSFAPILTGKTRYDMKRTITFGRADKHAAVIVQDHGEKPIVSIHTRAADAYEELEKVMNACQNDPIHWEECSNPI